MAPASIAKPQRCGNSLGHDAKGVCALTYRNDTTRGRTRRSTGKKLRFEVFKRDLFTCQYCGRQPPVVVLVTDHVTPWVAGGPTTIDNLLTSCEECNQGKSSRPLGDVVVRPDADLLYLAAQQEVAELRRYQASVEASEAALNDLIGRLQDTWASDSDAGWVPSERTIRALLFRFDPDVVGAAMRDVAVKVGGGYLPREGDAWVRYLWKVAATLCAEDSEPMRRSDADALWYLSHDLVESVLLSLSRMLGETGTPAESMVSRCLWEAA